jgi:beta-phosphoglucomutase-like phosphatase (HAD superfamily)
LILLVLFDVDGTLFLTHDPLAGEAMSETLEERFDVTVQPDVADRVDHLAQTTLRIARLVLREAGLEEAEIDRGLAAWCARFTERYGELLAEADTSDWLSASRGRAFAPGLVRPAPRVVDGQSGADGAGAHGEAGARTLLPRG